MNILIVTYDIETININNVFYPFAVGIVLKNKFEYFYLNKENIDENYKILINNSLEYLFNEIKNKANIIYIHNMAKFDSIFLIKYYNTEKYKIDIYSHQNNIYKISIKEKNTNYTINFYDSYKILPLSLEQASLAFNSKYKKIKIDYNIFDYNLIFKKNIKEEIINYLKFDCLSLYEIINIFVKEIYLNYNLLPNKYLTISSLSFKLWKTFYNVEIEKNIRSAKWKDEFIRNAYFGGRCEIYKPYVENAYFYDINSFYPYIMKTKKFPIGNSIQIIWDDKIHNLENFIGFLECEVESPPDIYLPILPKRFDNNTIYYLKGKWIGIYFIAEILLAKKYGYKIKPLKGIKYEEEGDIFCNYIDHLYEKRQIAKKEDKLYLSYIYKLLMNSLYGKFGMHTINIKQEVCNANELKDLLSHNNLNKKLEVFKVVQVDLEDTDKFYVEMSKISNNFNYNSSVQISAAITSYARCHLYEIMIQLVKENTNIYYIDTDAVVIDNRLEENFISKEKIGLFKEVYKIKKAYFLNEKMYYIITDDLQHIKRFKSMSQSNLDIFTEEKWQYYLKKDSYKYPFIFKNVFKILRDLKFFNIYSIKADNEFIFNYDKRLKVYKKNKWVDTLPKNI